MKSKAIIEQSETQIQQTCIGYARLFPTKIICEGTPAQAKRTNSGYMRMSSEGYISGSSDLKVFNQDKIIFIELKDRKGKQSDKQKEYQSLIESFGLKYFLVRSFDEFKSIVDSEFSLNK